MPRRNASQGEQSPQPPGSGGRARRAPAPSLCPPRREGTEPRPPPRRSPRARPAQPSPAQLSVMGGGRACAATFLSLLVFPRLLACSRHEGPNGRPGWGMAAGAPRAARPPAAVRRGAAGGFPPALRKGRTESLRVGSPRDAALIRQVQLLWVKGLAEVGRNVPKEKQECVFFIPPPPFFFYF